MTESRTLMNDVKSFIMEKFLPGEDPNELTPTTPLFSSGILDSISTVVLVSFLEDRYGVKFQAHEINATYLDTLTEIAQTVQSKQG